ncbi:MAG: ATP-binding protein [bacterium]
MIENIENEVDPMLDPLLEKQIIRRGRNNMFIKIAETEMDYDPKFRLYMTSRMANPLFSPELAAKTTIIDFTVTQIGLEQQLLGILIGKIEKQLEEQLTELNESVTLNKRELFLGEQQLLNKLATAEGSLLDDPTLIDVLAEIKSKSKEVTDKLQSAEVKTIEINEKREKYRPVAARGAVLYFCIVEMTLINWMYNTSLYQFLDLFHYGIDKAPKSQRVEERVENIIQTLTYKVYRYINRGLFEVDKVTFKMMVCLKIMVKAGQINS